MTRVLKYFAALIGTYLVVVYATGSGALIKSSGESAVNITKALQGR